MASHKISDLGDYAVSIVATRGFIKDLGLFVKYGLDAMDSRNPDMMLKLSETTIIGLVHGINTVMADLNEDNESYISASLGVLPHQIVQITPHKFSVHLQHHQEHLNYTFIINWIENSGCHNKALCNE